MKQLLVKTSGVSKGARILALHGWGMNAAAWQPIKAQLEAHYQVVWLDLPGYGDNADLVVDSLDQMVEQVQRVIQPETHLLGWSMGGLLALALARQNPNNISSMTLVASTPRFSQSDENDNDAWLHAMSQKVLSNFAKQLEDDLEGTLKRFIALQFMGVKEAKKVQQALTRAVLAQTEKTASRAVGETMLERSDDYPKGGLKSHKKGGGVLLHSLNSGLTILKEADFRSELRRSLKNIPLHWVLGGRDRLIPAEVINDLKIIRPDAQITYLNEAGHAPFMTHPDEFFAHLKLFINNTLKEQSDTDA